MRLKEIHPVDRPREKLISLGAQRLKNSELLAILINTGVAGHNSLEIAEQILTKYSLTEFCNLDYSELIKLTGINQAKACKILATKELLSRNKPRINLPISDSKTAFSQFSDLRNMEKEYLSAIYLNIHNEIIWKETLSIGILDATTIHPREVFEPAIRYLASSLIIAHNHPSNNPNPSTPDIEITHQLIEAGKILGIELLDHLVICKDNYFSFKDNNLI